MEWTLVERWASEGKLPAFRRLMGEGARLELASTAATLPDTVWSAIYSGTNPAHSAKYFYVQYDAVSGDLRLMDDDTINVTPFWEHLSAAGRRVAVLDAPKFKLSPQINGVQIANWGAHAAKTRRASYPPELLGEINRRFGPHPVGDCDAADEDAGSLWDLRRRILEGVALRGEVARFLMQRDDWDVFFASFSETHCVGHHFWHFLDEAHPRHDPSDQHALKDTVEAVYRAVDREVGELLELAGPETRCMVFSGHGMGPVWHASWNLQQVLDLVGFGKAGVGPAPSHQAPRSARVNPWRLLKMALPGRLQYAIKAMLPQRVQNELIFRWYAGPRDWKGRRAIAVPNNDSVGAIRILVEGRDAHGVVPPGDYRKVCETIAAALRELYDPQSGRKVVRHVTLLHEEFHGPYLDRLPDLTILWDQSFAWEEIASPAIGRLRIRRQDGRSGGHTPRGFLLARGYGESPGEQLPPATLYDIAPTALAAAGVEPPDVMEGQALFGGVVV